MCPLYDKTQKFLATHLRRTHHIDERSERYTLCKSAYDDNISKEGVALMTCNLPFKKTELDAIWSMKGDLKQLPKSGVTSNGELDRILCNIMKRYNE